MSEQEGIGSCGTAVRLALLARLHQVDCEGSLASLSDAEQEEWRFVWWTVFKLDCSVNVASVTPFGIDTETIATALVSSTVEDFTAGRVALSSKFIPEMDPGKSWTSVLELHLRDTGDGLNTHLLAVTLLRAVSQCQQSLNASPGPGEIGRVATLYNIFSSLHLALPPWFFNPNKRSREQFHAHRLRLETIIMLDT
jgi:hypothetical protein